VVINLLSNAHYAVRETPRPRFIRVAPQGSADRVTLEVADSGAGIRADVLERLFEPFFTTKPLGEGTGLGLAICKGIVETHGGSLSAESPPGQGAVFRMELPVEVGEPETIAEPTPESPVSGKAVLVVDDEPELATLLAEILGEDGHRVDTAENGAAALEKLREGAYDLIISDLRMPQLDGPGLYREVARRHPRLLRRMVFVTGDTLGPESTEFLRTSEAPTFSKPFVASDVRRAVRQATRDR
jgi:CheY-like chemotaxis protein